MLLFYLSLLDDQNDKPLFVRIYEQHKHKVYSVAFHILQNAEDAEDATMATWERVARYFPAAKKRQADSDCALEAWLIVIAKNAAKDEIRKRGEPTEPLEDWDVPSPMNVEEQSESEMMVWMIRTMPDHMRTVLEQRLVCGYSFKEIGQFLRCKADAARMRYIRALEALRGEMRAAGYVYGE